MPHLLSGQGVRLLCTVHDMELDVVWRPRNDHDPQQQLVEAYSKVQDRSDWLLHRYPPVYAQLLPNPIVGHDPNLDLFANSANSKVEGVLYSKYLRPGLQG